MIRFANILLAAALLFTAPQRAQADNVGINLASAVDWSTALPFLDLMKTARPWIGHGGDEWQVMNRDDLAAAGVLDDHGWPTAIPAGVSSIGTLVLTAQPDDAPGAVGRYVVRWQGTGKVEVDLGAENVTHGPNTIEFDYVPGTDLVHLEILETDPAGTGDYIRDITIVRKDRVDLFTAGELFNPDWLALIDGFDGLRFMDWMHTNDATLAHWADRPEVGDATWREHGVPVEIMIRLAEELGAEPWFNIPHLADDDFVRNFAELVHTELDPELRAWVEFSNEVWNWQFDQAHWADEQGKALWRRNPSWIQFYAGRATEVVDIWSEVYGTEAEDRLVRVIATQTGWMGLEQEILNASKWVGEERGRTAPGKHFDAYAITGYFGSHLGRGDWTEPVRTWIAESKAAAEAAADAEGLTGDARATYIEAHKYDAAVTRTYEHLAGADGPNEDIHDVEKLTKTLFTYHAGIAKEWGLDLVAYEGGTHVVASWENHEDEELNDFLMYFNYTPEMAALYKTVFDGWKAAGGDIFAAFLDVEQPSKYGSWGHLRYLGDQNPRWDALVAARDEVSSE